ncbi:MAG: carboxypeptidase regulatory-like domain-containing protein, partial [Acidobacteria bacterium]|nr:carboxypeptidase regulatory-like domain-containing protein [Acidobacteriota bacterium]
MRLILVALLSHAGVLFAEGALTGAVRDVSGTPVREATLQLLDSLQAVVASTTADSQGRFHFGNVAAGNYALLIARFGLVERRLPVQIGAAA